MAVNGLAFARFKMDSKMDRPNEDRRCLGVSFESLGMGRHALGDGCDQFYCKEMCKKMHQVMLARFAPVVQHW